jgi:hypothetical protein
MNNRKTIRVRIEKAFDYSKAKFKQFERKEWNEKLGTDQATNSDSLFFHAQCELCDELLNTERYR